MTLPAPEEIKIVPAYRLAEAARYLGASPSTLRTWFRGRNYKAAGQPRRSQPVLGQRGPAAKTLSFLDLIEAHVLHLVRRGYGIPLNRFRRAMDYLREINPDLHFLAHENFRYDHRNLFLRMEDRLVSLSERGQVVAEPVIEEGLKRLDYGADGFASRFLLPIAHSHRNTIALDPSIGFGRPVIARLGVKAEVIAARFAAGEGIQAMAEDFGAKATEIEDALRWCNRLAA
ncbi:MAG: DUF433 domain-containing protein [Verrucomicrobia bacterium]|jgi:uncharacterized protein (DUF433 family)|nr:DUF433 domain-containing protein [Verrucomicrobiota bacterium]